MRTAFCRERPFFLMLGIIFAVLAFGATGATAQKRFAFVIGNGAYQSVPKLPNALNDAAATRSVLQEAGFDVVPATDSTLAALRTSLEAFIGKVQQAGAGTTALVYYAGHAVQLDGTNYLLPIDVRPETSANIPGQALSLSDILKRLDATGAVAKVVILDACRNNPFAAQDLARGLSLQLVDGAADGIRSEAGLARIDSRSGTFVAFATSPGSTAADGGGANSPFTEALLKQIREPGLPIEQLFRRIRLDVHDATNGQQIPWDTSSLITDFSFFERRPGAAQPPAAAPATVAGVSLTTRPTLTALRGLSPADAYRSAIAWDRPDIYRNFLEARPDDERALRIHRIASQRTEETAWAETVRAGDAESFKLFARLYPTSGHVTEALRLAARAPSRNQIRTATACPVCPSAVPSRTRRADFTPRGAAPSSPPATQPRAPSPRRATMPQAAAPDEVVSTTPATVVPVPVLPLPEGPRWTGFYVGAHGGGGRQDSQVTVGGFGPRNSVATSIQVGNVPSRLSPSSESALGGVQAGFNVQVSSLVLGLETDLAFTNFSGASQVSVNPFGVEVTTRAEQQLNYLGTVRGRAGFAFGNLLIFGTGGYAYGETEQSGSITPNPAQNPTYSASRTRISGGWVAGGGLEYALGPRLSLRLDYLHYDLGSRMLVLNETTRFLQNELATMRASTKGNVVRAGFNLGF